MALDGSKTALVPHPRSLASTTSAGRDLASHLAGILREIDFLRAIERDEAPSPKPSWWDGYVELPDWKNWVGSPARPACQTDRYEFMRKQAMLSIDRLLNRADGKWDVLIRCIEIPVGARTIFESCFKSLRNLDGMLSSEFAVIPEEKHLASPRPGVWEPEPESEVEREAKAELKQAVLLELRTKGAAKRAATRARLQVATRLKRARSDRERRNAEGKKLSVAQGLVSSRVLAELNSQHERIEAGIQRWRLAEREVRDLLDWLEADPDKRPLPKDAERPYMPPGWTKGKLVEHAKCSGSTFDRIREAANVEKSDPGGKGQFREFSEPDLKKLIDAAVAGGLVNGRFMRFRAGGAIAAAWSRLLQG